VVFHHHHHNCNSQHLPSKRVQHCMHQDGVYYGARFKLKKHRFYDLMSTWCCCLIGVKFLAKVIMSKRGCHRTLPTSWHIHWLYIFFMYHRTKNQASKIFLTHDKGSRWRSKLRGFSAKSHIHLRHKISQAPRVSYSHYFIKAGVRFQFDSLIWYPSILEYIWVCGVHKVVGLCNIVLLSWVMSSLA